MRSLTFLTIFEQREVHSITVQRTKKIPEKNFGNKDAKIGHFHCFSDMKAGSASMMKVGCCVFLCSKKLLIIKVIINSDCFFQNRSLKSAFEILNKKQLSIIYLLFSRLFIMNNRLSSWIRKLLT